ncbi:hypothetical protein FISHEDRAFT_36637, partial [Fistulina hepatica ATCC 64428]
PLSLTVPSVYTPNTKVATVVGIIYTIVAILLMYRLCRKRDWWGLCLPIGYALGMYFRVATVKHHQDSRGWVILQQIFIACSPAAFLAFNYIVYGHLVVNCLGARHSWIRPTRVAFIFVSSDIVTFLVQAAGSSLLVTEHAVTGQHVFLVGLVLQSASYVLFFVTFLRAIYSVKREGIATGKEIWWKAVYPLGFSSIPILVRCVFRCIQIGLGRTNILSTDEVFFYCLDSLPLLLSIVIYVIWWPGEYIDSGADSIAEYKGRESEMQQRV